MLSIIVPMLDEAATIAAQLGSLQPLRARGAEVIVVDGGSTDNSIELATPLADRVIDAPRGRARQMNAGAAVASGDTLLFLHADTALPADADTLIAAARGKGKRWGRFDVHIEGNHRLLPMVAWFMNWRSRLTAIATGDQAIFVDRATFVVTGGFPDQALMEDIALSRKLREHSRPACLRQTVRTSGRRWERHGLWTTIILMWRLRFDYWRGTDPGALAVRYGYSPPTKPIPMPASSAIPRRVLHRPSSRPRVALLVFAKAPIPGAAKTRLIPALGEAGAAALAERLLERALSTAASAEFTSLQLWCAPDMQHPALIAAAARHGATLHLQEGEHLGQRMQAALADALAAHHAAVLIGTDCPELSAEDLRQAAGHLQGPRDVAIVPAADGGYVLVAMTRPNPTLFDGIDWGSERVMAQTRARASGAGLKLHLGDTRRDIDRPEDLANCELA